MSRHLPRLRRLCFAKFGSQPRAGRSDGVRLTSGVGNLLPRALPRKAACFFRPLPAAQGVDTLGGSSKAWRALSPPCVAVETRELQTLSRHQY